jgi:hypothetical protein
MNVNVPFGKYFELQMNNTFERRVVTQPEPQSYWFWSPQIKLSSIPLTFLKLSPFMDYQGYDNNDELPDEYLATSTFGIKSEPLENFNLQLAYSLQWKPSERNNRIRVIHIALGYTFDLSK